MKRVIGIDLATLKSAPRVVGIAGGESKFTRGAGIAQGQVDQCPYYR